mmetsp:Transcript_18723/g.61128  ORF Transcript_18723/g.61128 Transcript_18723/m.61128 type:complete len:220 (-) Transcript_18723:61-720(-)
MRESFTMTHTRHTQNLSLALAERDVLVRVPDTLALVRLRLAQGTNVRRKVAHLLLVDAGDGDVDATVHARLDALWQRHLVEVAFAQAQDERLPLHRRLVPHTHKLELLLEALRNAQRHVVRQRAAQPVQLPRRASVVALVHPQGPILLLNVHLHREGALERPLRPLDDEVLPGELVLHPLGELHRLLPNAALLRLNHERCDTRAARAVVSAGLEAARSR